MSQNDFDDQPGEEGRPQGPRYRGILGWVVIGALTFLLAYLALNGFSNAKEFSREQLEQLFAKPDALTDLYVRGDTLHGDIKPEFVNEFGVQQFTVQLQDMEVAPMIDRITKSPALLKVFRNSPDKNQSYIPENTLLWQSFLWMTPFLVFAVVIWFFISRQMRSASGPGGVLSFGRSRARLAKKERVKVTFDDVAGIDDAKEEVQEIVEFLRHPEKFQALGGRIPRGVMLVGPPGTGKTLLAKAIAGEANVPFFSISGSDFVEMFVGVGASRVRDLFRMAKENSPCIVFLDEIDAVGRRRTHEIPGGGQETSQTLNAILVEMDGFETNEQVIVVGATNRPDVLDPALRRPGRFDREVMVHLPDIKEREAILKVHAKKIKLAAAVDMSTVARGTPGFSGADLAAVINEAAIHATLLGKTAVEQDDLEECRDKVRWGRSKRSRAMDEADRRLSAYHEAGHVLMSLLLEPNVEPLHKVSIIPRGAMLGRHDVPAREGPVHRGPARMRRATEGGVRRPRRRGTLLRRHHLGGLQRHPPSHHPGSAHDLRLGHERPPRAHPLRPERGNRSLGRRVHGRQGTQRRHLARDRRGSPVHHEQRLPRGQGPSGPEPRGRPAGGRGAPETRSHQRRRGAAGDRRHPAPEAERGRRRPLCLIGGWHGHPLPLGDHAGLCGTRRGGPPPLRNHLCWTWTCG